MSKIRITCDSICDLTSELYQRHNIAVIPLCVTMGDQLYRDGVDVVPGDLFRYVDETGTLPTTSAISVGEYEEFFRPIVEEGFEIVHINLSSQLSSSYQNACIAAEEVGNIYPVDSRSLSTGSGHLVLLAASLAEAGYGAAEIARMVSEAGEKLNVSFIVQTLDYLHKGGRCSGLARFGANVLKIHPEINMENGSLHVGKMYRGSMEKSILDYVRGRLEGAQDVDTTRIFVTHSGVPAPIVEKVIALVRQLHPFGEVIETTAGSTISCHCGPNCLGVLFFRK